MIPRPSTFSTFLGQGEVIDHLKVSVKAATRLKRPHGHVLFLGPPGLGKTSLAASVLPTELGTTATKINCSSIEKPQDILPTLSQIQPGTILFCDEIHCLPRQIQETLYSVMEDFNLPIVIDSGGKSQTINLRIPPFTLAAATTREGLLPAPLRDRFRHILRLDLYSDEEMSQVLRWLAQNSPAESIDDEAISLLLVPVHGTARRAVGLVESCIETAAAWDAPTLAITGEVARATLKRLRYSSNGLSLPEVRLLRVLAASTRGTVGLKTVAAVVDEETTTVEEVYEPWLLRSGLIEKTPSGRSITDKGRQALTGVKP